MPPERGQAFPAASRALIAAILAVAGLQAWLVFTKAINWDEFFHFSQVYELQQGRLTRDLQVLHARLFGWATMVPGGVIRQIEAARLAMLGCELIAAAAIAGLARRFAGTEAALIAALAWIGGGLVFLHGFSFRADPMATASLMVALWLMGTRRLSWGVVLGAGFLIGLAGMMTVKAVIYAPCFAGIAWLRLAEADNRKATLLRLVLIPAVAAIAFWLILLAHRSGLPVAHSAAESVGADRSRFFAAGLFPQRLYMVKQLVLGPVLTLAVLAAPLGWKGRSRAERIALAGLLLPILTLVLYRNAWPYYYTFLMAPLAVSAAPLFAALRQRCSTGILIALLLAGPLLMTAAEPREVLPRQEATIAALRQVDPRPVGYLSWSGMVSDYPRVVDFLTSGVGVNQYYRTGNPRIAKAIAEGRLRFIIADHPVIALALEGKPLPETLLPADVAAMRAGFVHWSGDVWLARDGTVPPPPVPPLESGLHVAF